MRKDLITGLVLVIFPFLFFGCAGRSEETPVGATANGSFNQEEPGSYFPFTFIVEQDGDPIGINFQGTLARGRIKLQIMSSEGEIFQEWMFNEIGPFSLNTTLHPPIGTYHYGMVWEEPVQMTQYSLTWKPHPIETPTITILILLPGIGMVTVAVGFIIYAGRNRLGWGYLGLGALSWMIAVILKFAWAIPVNSSIFELLTGNLPEAFADAVFYIYVGALTGIFEVAIVWLVLRYSRLGQVPWEKALAFGIGFGAIEALLLGIGSLASAGLALTMPTSIPLEALEQIALTNNPLYAISPVWERFFIILVHIFSSVLLFYGARTREWRWFWLAFFYKTSVDAIAAFAQVWGVDTVSRVWAIEGLIALWGIAGWLGTRALRERYTLLDEGVKEQAATELNQV